MKPFERIILKHLIEYNDKISIFIFHDLYKISPGQMANFLRKFIGKKLIEYDGEFILLTPMGRAYILGRKKEIYFKVKMDWKKIPKSMNSRRIKVNQPYFSELSSNDIKSFMKYNFEENG